MYKDTKWAKEIIALQRVDGSWGHFHTLSDPTTRPVTTEQALRRLAILGFTIADEPIKKAVAYMSDCLGGRRTLPEGALASYLSARIPGKIQIPDRREVMHNWDIFTDIMLSTWIRKFTPGHAVANSIAETWARVIAEAFRGGAYDHRKYVAAYEGTFGMKIRGDRLVDFMHFYQVSLLAGMLDDKTEAAVFDYIMQKPGGIYYISNSPLSLAVLPENMASKQGSRYLGAMELLAAYRRNRHKLKFVVDWLEDNRNQNGRWDMGNAVNDKVYFPLSDSWRQKETREADCTYRVNKLLEALKA
jgi:hypothetical protein